DEAEAEDQKKKFSPDSGKSPKKRELEELSQIMAQEKQKHDMKCEQHLLNPAHGLVVISIAPDSQGSAHDKRDLVLQYCNGSAKDPPRFARWIRSRAHQFFHCPVEKTASTFWRRFTYQLEFTHPMRSPFDINSTFIYDIFKKTITVKEKGDALKKLWNQSIKQLYVRDPYSRLFSAYVDKILTPNPYYWRLWGVPALPKPAGKNNTASKATRCANSVTFPQFVNFALTKLGQSDHHLTPINRLCTPCAVNYTIIGKMETFRRDTLQLLALLNITEKQMEFQRRSEDASSNDIGDALDPSWLKFTLRCIKKENIIRRIWRKLQIRGIISWRIPYDLDPDKALTMTRSSLIAHMENVMSTSTNLTELKLQKRQAMLEAFASLKSSHLEKIKKVYQNDFLMFGYEPNMEALLSAQPIKITGALDWWKNWDMTSVLV
ncbi:carbohydrate sulfotransferase 12-like, partial [Physella acuta]|uniref:carbohydrate sulfotransferase 12-like n=1 Tax=Physella acuta TaxID=109671 RepID=UPI0027DC28D9